MKVNQLKAGAALNYVIIGLNALLGLVYTPFMLRMMGHSEYGLYSLVSSVIGYLTILDFGFGNAIIRYTAKYRAEGKDKEQSSMFGMFLILYSVIGLIAFIGGLALYFNVDSLFGATMTVDELSKAKIMMLILTFNLAVTFPFSIFGSIITAYENFVFQKVIQIARLLLSTAVIIVLLLCGYKAIAMVIVHTVFNVLTLLINLFYCKSKLKIRFSFGKFQWGFLKEITIYSFWIFLNAIMDKIYWSTGQFVLGAVSGTVAVSVFAVAIQLESMYMTFSTAISGVFLPKVSGMVARNSTNEQLSELFVRTGRIQFIVIGFILSGFVVFGRQFIDIWAGEGYSDSYIIALFFFVSLFIPLIQNLGLTILQARNQMKFRSLLYIIIAVVSLVFQIVLSKFYGGIGCAIAIAGALFLGQGICMNIYYSKRQGLNISYFWKEILKMSIVPIIVSIVGLVTVRFINFSSIVSLLFGICCFVILYVPLFWKFSMNQYERELFLPFIRKINRK